MLARFCRSRLFLPGSPGGGDERDRTDDPLLAKQVLSQLSYTPIFSSESGGLLPHLPLKAFRAFKIKQRSKD